MPWSNILFPTRGSTKAYQTGDVKVPALQGIGPDLSERREAAAFADAIPATVSKMQRESAPASPAGKISRRASASNLDAPQWSSSGMTRNSMSELSEKRQRLSNTDEVANLDVIRAVAVTSVFFAHLRQFIRPGYSDAAWHWGQVGVLMFFVHTSLVLMLSLERQQFVPRPRLTFYVRRWFRIYPLSIFFVLSLYPVRLALGGNSLTPLELFANLTLTQNLFRTESVVGVMWTLPLEVQMYVVLPFLFQFLLTRSWKWGVILWLASLPLGFIPLLVSDRLSTLEYAPCFLGGVLAWKLSRHYRPIFPSWLWPVGLMASTLIWFSAVNIRPYDIPLRWVFAVSLGTIIPMFHSMGNSLVTRAAAIIAKYSYGIYLSHAVAMFIGFVLLKNELRLVQWGVFAILAIAIPYFAFHVIEAPMIAFGKRVSGRTQPHLSSIAGSTATDGSP